jgi:GxxExxY protein
MERDLELTAREIVDSAIKVHKAFGPGLLESAYQHCLIYELRKRGLRTQRELELPIEYDGVRIDAGYRIDMRVEDCIVVENKTVDHILPIHLAQLLTYLKLSGCPLGFLINWKVNLMKDGIRRLVWHLNEPQRARR